jgi:homoserine O-acetyltransferase
MRHAAFAALVLLAGASFGAAADYPAPKEGDFVLKDFHFDSGETLPEVRIHYRTIGRPERGKDGKVRNAVLILHGTTGQGGNFVGRGRPDDWFADPLFGPDQPLDGRRYFIVLPDNIGHGKSSRPSEGLHSRFPRYGYHDMIRAQYQLLTDGLGVDHMRLVMGTSMGGMHTWLWGQLYPDYMDALLPLASLPTQISGRNRLWRKTVSDAIRSDSEWQGGDYKAQPHSLRTAAQMMLFVSSNPVLRQKEAPTLKAADKFFDAQVAAMVQRLDTNDVLYAVEASWDYDPGPGLGKIRAPLLAINFADDLINPPELGILEREIKRVSHGRAVVIPMSAQTAGHGTHTKAAVWKHYLEELLKESER